MQEKNFVERNAGAKVALEQVLDLLKAAQGVNQNNLATSQALEGIVRGVQQKLGLAERGLLIVPVKTA